MVKSFGHLHLDDVTNQDGGQIQAAVGMKKVGKYSELAPQER